MYHVRGCVTEISAEIDEETDMVRVNNHDGRRAERKQLPIVWSLPTQFPLATPQAASIQPCLASGLAGFEHSYRNGLGVPLLC